MHAFFNYFHSTYSMDELMCVQAAIIYLSETWVAINLFALPKFSTLFFKPLLYGDVSLCHWL